MACLQTKELVVSPGEQFVTKPLNIAVERGEILCLVGPSGCGKTTFIRAIAGLLTPISGTIELADKLLNDPAIRIDPGKRKIGMVFQNLALWPHMGARDQVTFAMSGGGKKKRATALLGRLGLGGKEKARPGQLSGGEGQRVALARALGGEPDLLLMDEPLRSVDPHLRASIGKLIREVVREQNVACIMVTHDREEALTLGDRIAVMKAGEILDYGTPETLLDTAEHPFVTEFLKAGNISSLAPEQTPKAPDGSASKGPGPGTRLSVLLAVLAGITAAICAFSSNEQGMIIPPTYTSSAQCKACHKEVYAEWRESWHGKAWTNPEVQRLSNNFRNKECLACHLPRPILVTGVEGRVQPRTTRKMEGVDCLACHQDENGRIIGMRDVPTAPCAPVKNPLLNGNAICAPCHNQHFTMDQWEKSPAAKAGKNCNACHMEDVARRLPDGTTAPGRSHVFAAGHHPLVIRSAVRLKVEKNSTGLLLTVKNETAGHNYPTDSRHKASDLLIRYQIAGKWEKWLRVARFRQPYREQPGPNTQIPAGESRQFSTTNPPGASAAEVRLDYRATPFVPDSGAVDYDQEKFVTAKRAVVLYRQKVELP